MKKKRNLYFSRKYTCIPNEDLKNVLEGLYYYLPNKIYRSPKCFIAILSFISFLGTFVFYMGLFIRPTCELYCVQILL